MLKLLMNAPCFCAALLLLKWWPHAPTKRALGHVAGGCITNSKVWREWLGFDHKPEAGRGNGGHDVGRERRSWLWVHLPLDNCMSAAWYNASPPANAPGRTSFASTGEEDWRTGDLPASTELQRLQNDTYFVHILTACISLYLQAATFIYSCQDLPVEDTY